MRCVVTNKRPYSAYRGDGKGLANLLTRYAYQVVGSKGGGEDGCIATSTVLMGAVADALRPLGVKVMSSPHSPARNRAMIAAASGALN